MVDPGTPGKRLCPLRGTGGSRSRALGAPEMIPLQRNPRGEESGSSTNLSRPLLRPTCSPSRSSVHSIYIFQMPRFFDRIPRMFPVSSSKFRSAKSLEIWRGAGASGRSPASEAGRRLKWSIGNAWKAFVPFTGHRGFEIEGAGCARDDSAAAEPAG